MYYLLDQTQSWVKVRCLRLVGRLIELEPRLAKKVESKIHALMTATNGKSVECELLQIAVRYYESCPSFSGLIKNKIDYFSESQDINLNIKGFRGLRVLLDKKPELLNEYSELLAKKARVDDAELATEIFSIYAEHLSKEDAPAILSKMNDLLTTSQIRSYRDSITNAAASMALRDPPIIIDWSDFVAQFLPVIIETNKQPQNHEKLMQCLRRIEKQQTAEILAPLYEAALKNFGSCTTEPAIHMAMLLCRHPGRVSDTEWLDGLANDMSVQGGLVVDCLIVGAKVQSMAAGESEASCGDEVRYLLGHPSLRKELKKITCEEVVFSL